jgi:disulfide bond formation protein DsbB
MEVESPLLAMSPSKNSSARMALIARTLPLTALLAVLTAFPASAQPVFFALFGGAFAVGDFNGDGFPDLAVGAPGYTVNGRFAGAVNVLYGSASGLTADGSQLWHQDSPGIADQAENADNFGSPLASGDFDGDGFDDLAVGALGEDLANPARILTDAGAVHVLYGSPTGLTASGSRFGHQDSPGVEGAAGGEDFFGWSLASGDFDGDGFDDLAVGALGDRVGSVDGAGAVNVFYGSRSGLTVAGDQLWTQESPGVEDDAEAGDNFGNALAAGDFDGDGHDDLAAGVYNESLPGAFHAGAVAVLYGSASGLAAEGNQLWHQDSPGVLDLAEASDTFGSALAAGDFDGDGLSDLAVGVPLEDVFGVSNAGAANVLYGSASGLTDARNQLWHQDSPGVEDENETSNLFGDALTSGDFDGDGFDDLAVGVPQENFGNVSSAGAANVLYGSAAGLSAVGNQLWFQELDGLPDLLEFADHFGRALAAGDFDGSGHDDLAIGVPSEDVAGVQDAGAVNVLYGSTSGGLSAAGNQFWHQGLLDALRLAEAAPPSASAAPGPGSVATSPNPFAGRTTFSFEVAGGGPVRVSVYDGLGREVAVLVDGELAAGRHAVTFDGSSLPAGVYVVSVAAGGTVASRTVTLLR